MSYEEIHTYIHNKINELYIQCVEPNKDFVKRRKLKFWSVPGTTIAYIYTILQRNIVFSYYSKVYHCKMNYYLMLKSE